MRRRAAISAIVLCLALLGGCVSTSTAKKGEGESVDLAYLAENNDATAKRAALPQLVDLLSDRSKQTRAQAFAALAGPGYETSPPLVYAAQNDAQLCPRLTKGLMRVWGDLGTQTPEREIILTAIIEQECTDAGRWLWRRFADTPRDTQLGQWALEHDGEADNDALIKLLANSKERYGRRKVYLKVLSNRSLTLAQRARTLPVLKDRSLDPFERRNLACRLLEAHPRLNDELLLTALGDRNYPVAYRIIFLDFLSNTSPLEVVRRIAEDPAESIELRAKAREVLAGR